MGSTVERGWTRSLAAAGAVAVFFGSGCSLPATPVEAASAPSQEPATARPSRAGNSLSNAQTCLVNEVRRMPAGLSVEDSLRPHANAAETDPTVAACIRVGISALVSSANPGGAGELCQIAADACAASLNGAGLTSSGVPAVASMPICVAAGECAGFETSDISGVMGSCLGCEISAQADDSDGGAG